MWRGISLANKCLLLFGGAIVLIVLTALSVPWLRMNALVDDGQLALSRQMADTWIRLDDQAGSPVAAAAPEMVEHAGIRAIRMTLPQAEQRATVDPFIARVIRRIIRPQLRHFQKIRQGLPHAA